MCFSATASFTASFVIGTTGTISFVRSRNSSQRLFSAVPILFAVQQCIEGFVWLSFSNPELVPYRHGFTIAFLFFAWMIWPVLIPYAVARLETVKRKRTILYTLTGVGVLLMGLYTMFLAFGDPEARINSFHIDYFLDDNPDFFPRRHFSFFYLLAVVAPFFVSSVKRMWILGLVNLIGLSISVVFYREALPSTWCFFAAFFSVVIIYVIEGLNKGSDVIAENKLNKTIRPYHS